MIASARNAQSECRNKHISLKRKTNISVQELHIGFNCFQGNLLVATLGNLLVATLGLQIASPKINICKNSLVNVEI